MVTNDIMVMYITCNHRDSIHPTTNLKSIKRLTSKHLPSIIEQLLQSTMNDVFKMSRELNRVVAYYNQDECNIDGSYYHANKLGASQKYLLEMRCCLTRDTLEILFVIKRGEVITDVSDRCIINIRSSNDSSPSHTFMYLDGHVYHSYALKYTLCCSKVNREVLRSRLDIFLSLQNEENWKKITGVCEPDFSGEYEIEIIGVTGSDVSQAKCRAKKLLEDALEALRSGKNCYDYDDYTYVLSLGVNGTNLIEGGETFLCGLIERLNR